MLSQHPPNSNASDNGVGTEATDGNTVNLEMQRYVHVHVHVCIHVLHVYHQ